MKRIGILTFHQALNYGAVLQAYALCRAVSDNCPDVKAEIVDYRCPYLSDVYGLSGQKRKKLIRTLLASGNYLVKKKRFCSFRKKHLPVSPERYGRGSVKAAVPGYDCFIVGSDQVWNPELTNNDLNYFLHFAPPCKRFSYAASVGSDKLDPDISKVIAGDLRRFRTVSVREKSAKAFIDSIAGDNAAQVHIDPTLLLSKREWEKLCGGKRSSGYILVYSVKYSQRLIDEALRLAAKKGLKVLCVGQYRKNRGVKYIHAPDCGRLLSLFRNADYVFTNSFHGTAFSVIFERQFCSMPDIKDDKKIRILDLLSLLDLNDRTSPGNIDTQIPWKKVRGTVQRERDKSLEYLRRIADNGE